jgi:phenylalanyl-tRNA synthetase beta subunit
MLRFCQAYVTFLTAGDEVLVEVGPTRHDVIHQCDLEEDIAIAYGYNNITKRNPTLYTIGMWSISCMRTQVSC